MKILYTLVFLLLGNALLHAQLSGKVTDKNGEALSFASIYVQGTSHGTTSNIEGNFSFNLKKGTHQLVFQYIGFKQKIISVTIGNQPVTLDVELEEESFSLKEIIVAADAEDPAYPIIRKAISKRKYYKDLVQEYSCNVYIKGGIKLLDAPEKIMGQEIGDLGGQLDSNRQGIVYLSESEANLHFQQPDKYKEIMISSKVSGNDNGFSFNRASEMDFNLYRNFAEFQRQVMSPIAANALQYYRYKLLGTFFDENGHLVNKIKVIPKRAEDPVYEGTIYIVDKLWNIQSADLWLTSAAMKLPGLDTLWMKQVHVPVKDPDVWMLFSQTLTFKAGLFKFKLKGDFTGIFRDYNITPTFQEKYFNNEILVFEEGANEKDLTYWDSIRPVPLTLEEDKDYIKKDSLQKVWDSKEYKDSIDRKNNKFGFGDVLFGYTYQNSWKRFSLGFDSPLSTVQFNPVQGWLGSLNFNFRQNFDERRLKWIAANPKIQYGFGDEKWRASFNLTYNMNRTNFQRIGFGIGKAVVQFNDQNPISPVLSELYNLFDKANYMKVYENTFSEIFYRQEIVNGILGRFELKTHHRKPLEVNSNYSFRKKEEVYEPNIPDHPYFDETPSAGRRAITFEANFRFRIGQKYLKYPNRKYIMGSKYPDFYIIYKKAFGEKKNAEFANYDQLVFHIADSHLATGLLGHSEFSLKAGTFFNKKNMHFTDYQHFNGNQTFIFNPNRYMNSFMQLPYYQYSTNNSFFEGHYQHHFEGFLLDKIPLIQKLGWQTVAGASFLYTKEQKDYLELSFGIDNIGFGIFRLFRVDVVGSFVQGKYDNVGVLLGIKL